METQEQYLTRRAQVHAELTGSEGDDDFLVLWALGRIKPSIVKFEYTEGFMSKRQAE